MPVLPNLDPTDWILRAMQRFNLKALPTKRTRRPVPYAHQILAIAGQRGVNFGAIKQRRRGR